VRVEVFPTRTDLTSWAAARVASQLRRNRRLVLLLPVGRTVIPIYRALALLNKVGWVSFRRATTFNLDELRVSPPDSRSFRAFMERNLFSKIDLPRRQIRFLRGDAPDVDRECARYERQLAREGLPDVALVGIGANGHVAYLEPARSLPPRTSLVRLSASTRRGLAADGVRPVPREAFTVGIETILSSKAILLVATGRKKAAAVAAALAGPVTPRCPASFLSLHPRLEILLDRAAASLLADPGSRASRERS